MTTTIPTEAVTPPTEAELAELGQEYLDLLEMQAEITTRMDEIKAAFRALPFGAHMAGDHLKVSIQHNVTRDDARFREAFPFESFPHYYKPAVDTATVKRELAPAVLEQFQVEGAPKVVTSVIED